MTMTAPTRITIEVHHPASVESQGITAPIVRVVPDGSSSISATASEGRQEVAMPAAYDPGPCLCLDDEDCRADHAND